ncbi:alpha/beta hydrolase [Nocardioides caricicola]|uniref:Alpha/beta fold hydrolase n=1 Tax=Nocardioides caricicola TaxID=634770 RepID=A0ABW0N4F4_9ACTN
MQTVVVNETRVAYRRVGEGRPVLLCGGTGMPLIAWETSGFEAALVDAGFEVISHAARGVAPSDAPPPPYSVDDLATDAAGLVDHLGLTDVTAIGYSLGSFAVEVLGRQRPTWLRSVVMLAGAGPATAVLNATVAMEEELIAAVGHVPSATAAFQTLMTGLPPSLIGTDDPQVAQWAELFALQGDVWTSRDGEVGQAAAARAWASDESRMGRLGEIEVPSLVVAYEHDPMFPPASSRLAVAELRRGELATVAGASHAGLLTHPRDTAEVIVPFLGRS